MAVPDWAKKVDKKVKAEKEKALHKLKEKKIGFEKIIQEFKNLL